MTTISTAPVVKAALRSVLAAADGLERVQITHGNPTDRPGPELVVIGPARPDAAIGERQPGHTPRGLGNPGREERYSLLLIASVRRGRTDSYPEIEARAYEIASLVDAAIRNWRTTTPAPFDGVARWVLVASTQDFELWPADAPERGCAVQIDLAVAAQV